MKKKILSIFAIFLMLAFVAPATANHQVVFIVQCDSILDLSINQSTYTTDVIPPGGEAATGSSWCNISNIGNVPINVSVSCSNSSDWVSKNTPGHNEFQMNMTFSSHSSITLDNTYLSLYNTFGNIAVSGSEKAGFQIFAPTTVDAGQPSQAMVISFISVPA